MIRTANAGACSTAVSQKAPDRKWEAYAGLGLEAGPSINCTASLDAAIEVGQQIERKLKKIDSALDFLDAPDES
jgi:hypothetical protein